MFTCANTTIQLENAVLDRGQTDHVIALPRPYALDFAAAADFRRATPHTSPC